MSISLNQPGGAIKELSDDTCCGRKAFLFLFPARSSILHLLFVVLLGGVYGSLNTYFIHP
jgi:hypothetical protein